MSNKVSWKNVQTVCRWEVSSYGTGNRMVLPQTICGCEATVIEVRNFYKSPTSLAESTLLSNSESYMVSTAVSVSPHPSCQICWGVSIWRCCLVSSVVHIRFIKIRLKILHPVFLSQGISLYQQKGQPPSWLILYRVWYPPLKHPSPCLAMPPSWSYFWRVYFQVLNGCQCGSAIGTFQHIVTSIIDRGGGGLDKLRRVLMVENFCCVFFWIRGGTYLTGKAEPVETDVALKRWVCDAMISYWYSTTI
jgi:hypothetical protein